MDENQQDQTQVTGNSEQQDVEYDFSSFTTNTDSDSVQSGEEVKDNPKWTPFLTELENLPDVFKAPLSEKLKSHLKEWDRGINERFQEINNQHAPYKPFIEQKLDPQRLMAAYQVTQQMAADPVKFFNDLQATLTARGLLQAQQQETQQELEPPDVNDPYYKELQELRQKFEEQSQYMSQFMTRQQQEQRQQVAVQEELGKINQGFANIEKRLGQPLTPQLQQTILEKAMVLAQNGHDVTIEQAAVEVFKTLNSLRVKQPAPPRGIPTSGSDPHILDKPAGELTREERLSRAQEIRARFMEQ